MPDATLCHLLDGTTQSSYTLYSTEAQREVHEPLDCLSPGADDRSNGEGGKHIHARARLAFADEQPIYPLAV